MMPPLLIAPTEPSTLKLLGTVSSVPETHGVDVLWPAQAGLWGIQRKEFSDLVASLRDGRLGQEIAQMCHLVQGVLLVENQPDESNWMTTAIWGPGITRSQYRRLLYTVRAQGVWVEHSDSLADTVVVVEDLVAWSQKAEHSSLKGRPGPNGSAWGRVTNRDWARHLLTSFPGVGPELADRIIEHFQGVPLRWDVDRGQMEEIPGLGKKKVERLYAALQQERRRV